MPRKIVAATIAIYVDTYPRRRRDLMMGSRLCRFVGIPLPPLVAADLLKRIIPGLFFLGRQLGAELSRRLCRCGLCSRLYYSLIHLDEILKITTSMFAQGNHDTGKGMTERARQRTVDKENSNHENGMISQR